jgi:hypothetical protein
MRTSRELDDGRTFKSPEMCPADPCLKPGNDDVGGVLVARVSSALGVRGYQPNPRQGETEALIAMVGSSMRWAFTGQCGRTRQTRRRMSFVAEAEFKALGLQEAVGG